ncbi:hypothetical protein [Pseudoxanthomonas winnipegensis]|jgi:hypothetical protein|uniref:Uncharacterized protein n=1 Tax=Pseudoxanthomonas winnipegensis TaxID=2480810 RepID=A0A4V2HCI9_9GAMM|nr:hypothetical protein [Pseudoxanthomonas winnipegensis]PZP59174.1 MAG: hypothetical protein DI597_17130 [Pseudoxanthomonas spadix]TAA20116.1 hypothetical protein EA660_18970 [Pseudoxanthomonas winnipegensis]
MDTSYISALAGLAGAAIGGMTSFITTWLTQRNSIRDQHTQAQQTKLEVLFGDFINEASRLYGDALTHEQSDIAHLVKLYALLGRIRLVASRPVVDAAERTMKSLIDTYGGPNRTIAELRELATRGRFNFLHDFSEACRSELSSGWFGHRH